MMRNFENSKDMDSELEDLLNRNHKNYNSNSYNNPSSYNSKNITRYNDSTDNNIHDSEGAVNVSYHSVRESSRKTNKNRSRKFVGSFHNKKVKTSKKLEILAFILAGSLTIGSIVTYLQKEPDIDISKYSYQDLTDLDNLMAQKYGKYSDTYTYFHSALSSLKDISENSENKSTDKDEEVKACAKLVSNSMVYQLSSNISNAYNSSRSYYGDVKTSPNSIRINSHGDKYTNSIGDEIYISDPFGVKPILYHFDKDSKANDILGDIVSIQNGDYSSLTSNFIADSHELASKDLYLDTNSSKISYQYELVKNNAKNTINQDELEH